MGQGREAFIENRQTDRRAVAPEVEELCTYWADHPPMHLMVAAYVGVGSKIRPRSLGSARGSPAAAVMTLTDLETIPGWSG
jgi:hypothetical protein